MNKCILMMSKHHPPLPLIMQIRDCVLGTGAGEERAGPGWFVCRRIWSSLAVICS